MIPSPSAGRASFPSLAKPCRPLDVSCCPKQHFVNHGRPIKAPFPEGLEVAAFGLGCFWGAERKLW